MVKTRSNLISSYFSPKKQAQSKATVNRKQKLQQQKDFTSSKTQKPVTKKITKRLSQVVYGVAEIIGILIRHNDDQESLKEFAKLCVKILENLYKLREQENRLQFTELGEIFEQYLADCIYQNKAFKQELIQQNVLEVAIKLRWNLPLLYQLISMLDNQILLVLDIQNKTGYELKIDGIDSIQKLELLLGNCLNDYNPKLYCQKLGSEIKNCIAYNENLLNIEPQEKNQSIQSYDNMSHQEESTLDSEKQKSFKSVSSFNSEKSEEIKSDQLSSFQFLENFYKQTLEQKIPKQLITDSFWNLYNWTAIDSKGRIIDPDNLKKKVQIPWGSHILFSEDIPSDILECSFLQNQRVVVLGRQSLKSQIGVKINSDSLMYKVKGLVQIKKQLSTKQYNEIISKLAQVSQEKKQQIQNDNIRSKHLFPQQF